MIVVTVETIEIAESGAEYYPRPMGSRRRGRPKRPAGSFTCRHCHRVVVFPHAIKLIMYLHRTTRSTGRIVLLNPITRARIHDCAVDKLYFCESCQENREVRSYRGRAEAICPECREPLRMVQQDKVVRERPLKPLDLF